LTPSDTLAYYFQDLRQDHHDLGHKINGRQPYGRIIGSETGINPNAGYAHFMLMCVIKKLTGQETFSLILPSSSEEASALIYKNIF
jgi:hypothetical protein